MSSLPKLLVNNCVCTGPGWCARHGVEKSALLVRLCQKNPNYWNAWEAGYGPGQPRAGQAGPPPERPPKQVIMQRGPGTELKKILKRFGITAISNCPCNNHAMTMDIWGCDKCLLRMETIVGWLRKEAEKRHLPFVESAARMVIRRAVHNARKRLPLESS